MERLSGKVAVVMEACSRMGAAVAETLVENGLQVVGVGTHVELIQENAVKLSGKPGKLHGFKLDMTQESEITAAFIYAETFGPVHILINNVVSYDAPPEIRMKLPWKRMKFRQWKNSGLGTNVTGLHNASLEAVMFMKKAGVDGHIVYISTNLDPLESDTVLNDMSQFSINRREKLHKDGYKIKISILHAGTVKFLGSTADAEVPSFELPRFMRIVKSEDVVNALLYILGTAQHVQVHELEIIPT